MKLWRRHKTPLSLRIEVIALNGEKLNPARLYSGDSIIVRDNAHNEWLRGYYSGDTLTLTQKMPSLVLDKDTKRWAARQVEPEILLGPDPPRIA